MGPEKLPLKKRRASGKPQKPSADRKFPVRLEVKDSMGLFGCRVNIWLVKQEMPSILVGK